MNKKCRQAIQIFKEKLKNVKSGDYVFCGPEGPLSKVGRGARINKFVTGDRNDGRHSSCILQLATHFPDSRRRNPETRETRKFRICERPNPGYEPRKLFVTRET
jgi:hypothetical protein